MYKPTITSKFDIDVPIFPSPDLPHHAAHPRGTLLLPTSSFLGLKDMLRRRSPHAKRYRPGLSFTSLCPSSSTSRTSHTTPAHTYAREQLIRGIRLLLLLVQSDDHERRSVKIEFEAEATGVIRVIGPRTRMEMQTEMDCVGLLVMLVERGGGGVRSHHPARPRGTLFLHTGDLRAPSTIPSRTLFPPFSSPAPATLHDLAPQRNLNARRSAAHRVWKVSMTSFKQAIRSISL